MKTSLTEPSPWFNDRNPMAKKTAKKSAASKPATKSTPKAAKVSAKAHQPKAAPVKVAKPLSKVASKVAEKAQPTTMKAPAVAKKTPKVDLFELPPLQALSSEPQVNKPDIDFQRNPSPEEIILTDAEGRRYCRVKDCDQVATVDLHCRFHYLLLWKRIQVRRKILQDGKLSRYVDELTSRYPDKFLEMIRKDLRSEKDFLGAIGELEIDEAETENEYGDDSAAEFIEEVRGVSSESSIAEDTDF